MNVIEHIHDLTFSLHEKLCDKRLERQDKIDAIYTFLELQETLLPSIPEEKTEKEVHLITELIKIGPELNDKMNEILSGIKKDIARVKNTKKFSNQQTPFSKDGTFFDAKR
ncbi:hypothetical protein QTG56_23600 (plasmid) [Rossellomorea sp. AcN35-11]|nr:hypothetical protein [Rossellomorea aquimaris]WJV32349.1 hypothetical protein QTG56_23600 [Rossellomorea sp. AcN35-11]